MDDYLIRNLSAYIGESDNQLKKRFGINKVISKRTLVEIAYKMAGVSSNRLQELKDENIVIKTIRINSRGKIKESMSFPTIQFRQLVQENWEESYIYSYFKSTKILFVVYKEIDFGFTFLGGTYWKMSFVDLNVVMKEWQDIQDRVRSGLEFDVKKGVVSNNLPKKSQTEIIHLRPKANKAAYSLNNGFNCGDIKKDGDQLPNGEWMTKQCFWLNNDYVLKQVEKESVNVKYANNMLAINQVQCDLLKKYLIEEFYLIDEFKKIFLSTLDVDDEKYFNAFNIDKVGYKFNFTYVYSNEYESINKYIESILLSEEIVDLRKVKPKLLELANIEELLDELIKTLPVIAIQRNVFVDKNRLYRGGVMEEKLELFAYEISSKYKENYFTIYSLRMKFDNELLFNDGFEDCFYENILTCSSKFKSFVVDGTKVFCGLNLINKFPSFLEYLVGKILKVDVLDLKEIIHDRYRLDIDEIRLGSALRFSNLYFNQDIKKVYINHDEFIKNVILCE